MTLLTDDTPLLTKREDGLVQTKPKTNAGSAKPNAKPSAKAQAFQTWLSKFRSTGNSGYVLLATPEMSDEQLRELWKEATKLFHKKVGPVRRRKS